MALRRSTASSRGGPASFFAPVAVGAIVLGGTALLRAVVALPLALLAGHRASVGMAMLAVALAAGAGAVGGLIYSLIGRPLRHVRWVGAYAAGIVTAAAYLGAALWAVGRIEPSDGLSMTKLADRIAFAAGAVFFGVLLGAQFAKDDQDRARATDHEDSARATHVAT